MHDLGLRHVRQRVMSICYSSSVSVRQRMFSQARCSPNGHRRRCWNEVSVAGGRTPADRDVNRVENRGTSTPTCYRPPSPPSKPGERNTGQLDTSLCPDVAMRQLPNEARLDNFGAATLRLQHGARSAADGDEWLSEQYSFAIRRGLSRLVYRRQSNGKLRTHRQSVSRATKAACSRSAQCTAPYRRPCDYIHRMYNAIDWTIEIEIERITAFT